MPVCGRHGKSNQENNMSTEDEAKKEEKKAKQEAKKQAEATEGAQLAESLTSAYDVGDMQMTKLGDLEPWELNPRTAKPEAAELASSMFDASGKLQFDCRFPFVVFPADPKTGKRGVIQGNRRLALMQLRKVDPDTQIPIIEHQGTVADALLVACNDTGSGISEKGIGDMEAVVGTLIREHSLSAYTVIAYLWRHNRRLLGIVSPAVKQVIDLPAAQPKAYGRMQTLAKIARLPEPVRAKIYEEHNEGTRKGKVFDGDTVKKLCAVKGDTPEIAAAAYDKIIQDRKDELDNPDTKPVNKLTGKTFADMLQTFSSPTMRKLAALFAAPDKDDIGRDVIQLVKDLDASIT